MDTAKMKMNCLNKEEVKQLTDFIEKQFGIKNVWKIENDGPDVRIINFEFDREG